MPGDVPLITPADVATILAEHERFTLVPDSEGDGTNCIVSSPPNLIRYRFDGHSFKPHAEAAYGIGITPRIVRNDAFGIDVDTPRDLSAHARAGGALAHANLLRNKRYSNSPDATA